MLYVYTHAHTSRYSMGGSHGSELPSPTRTTTHDPLISPSTLPSRLLVLHRSPPPCMGVRWTLSPSSDIIIIAVVVGVAAAAIVVVVVVPRHGC